LIEKVISGGQTGADRAALEAAADLGIATGGWVPRGRRAEDGPIPDRYEGLLETGSDAYETRTALNVRDSDATLIFSFGPPQGGTALTVETAVALQKPVLVIDLEQPPLEEAVRSVCEWLDRTRPRILNVAGPRMSEEPRIGRATARVLQEVLRRTAV